MSPALQGLAIPKFLHESAPGFSNPRAHTGGSVKQALARTRRRFQPAQAGGSIKPGVEARAGTPGRAPGERLARVSGRQTRASNGVVCRPLRELMFLNYRYPGVPATASTPGFMPSPVFAG